MSKKSIPQQKSIEQKIKLGYTLYQNREYKKSRALFYDVLKALPLDAEIRNILGVLEKNLKNYKKAKNNFLEAISLNPKKADYYANYSNLLKEIGDLKGALIQISNAIEFKNNDSYLFNSKGIILEKLKDFKNAEIFYKIAIKIDPKNYKAYNNLAVFYYNLFQYQKALEYFKKALEANPEYVEVYSNIGAVYNKLKEYDLAILNLKKAIRLNPKNAGAYTNLGNVYNKLDRYEDAIKMHKKSILLDPKGVNAYSNLANSYKFLGKFQEAIKFYKKALKLNPNFVNAKFDLATTYLHIKDFKNGWLWYESRFEKDEMKGHIAKYKEIFFANKLKRNTKAKGKTILIHSEQGFGDSILFVRFVEMVKQKFKARVILQCRDELKSLFENSIKGVDYFYKRDSFATPDFDFQISMLSLPHLFDIHKVSDIPYTKEPYLFANLDEDVDFESKKRLKIGICWGASVTGESFEGKVFPLEYFRPLCGQKDIEVVSLQVGEKSKDIKKYGLQDDIVDITDKLDNFNKTANLINKLDLIITSDTSVAHLGGALGKKTWVVLQKMPDWRWEHKGEKSYWYESVRLFRQDDFRDWDSAFKKVYQELNKEFDLNIEFKKEQECRLQ